MDNLDVNELEKIFQDDTIDENRNDESTTHFFINTFGFQPFAPRHRLFSVSIKKPLLHIYGRCGGDNTDEYLDEINDMELIPGFLLQEEDYYDCTYRDFYYKLDKNKWEEFIGTCKTVPVK
jgi:hypothetical protein